LGRERVRALLKGDVEMLSDFQGVVYIKMDSGSWKLELAREMKQFVEFDIDLNKLS
jgi:predicted nucleotide-binding protein